VFYKVELFSQNKSLFFVTKHMCFIVTNIHQASISPAWCSITQKPSFYLSRTLAFAKDRALFKTYAFYCSWAQNSILPQLFDGFDPAHFG
jgi:hypothetical protein